MLNQLETPTDQSATALMGGIIQDVQHLVKQQLALTRQEIADDVRKVKEGTVMFAFGGGLLLLGAVSLCFALAHVLHWSTSPSGSDPATIPLWACHAIVGVGFAVMGGIFVWSGEAKWKTINPMHNPAADALKDNVQWGLHPK
jgi:hypothetical protein